MEVIAQSTVWIVTNSSAFNAKKIFIMKNGKMFAGNAPYIAKNVTLAIFIAVRNALLPIFYLMRPASGFALTIFSKMQKIKRVLRNALIAILAI